ncbi:MAG: ABC transporter permease [Eubacteriales bacterium]
MPVYELSMKIIKKNLPSMLIYFFIFIGITMLFASMNTQQQEAVFSESKVNMTFIAEENTPLVEGFQEALSPYANFVTIEDEKEALQDALFFRTVEYIVRIPAGFTDSFMQGNHIMQLEITTLPSSVSGRYIDITIDQYFNTARLYVDGIPDITQEQLVKNLHNDLHYRTPVEFQNEEVAESNHIFAKNYFNYLAYTNFSILILGLSAVILVFNKKDIKRRNSCSPLSPFRTNMEFLLAHLSFTVIAWAVMMICYLIFDHQNSQTIHTIYFMLNAFIFTLCASSASFLIGNLIKSQNSLSAITNVVTLGPCFISGIFVPQELLSPAVLKIASFTPTYWFAKANGIISGLTQFNSTQLQPVLSSMLIQLGFAVAFLSITLVLKKKRSVEN